MVGSALLQCTSCGLHLCGGTQHSQLQGGLSTATCQESDCLGPQLSGSWPLATAAKRHVMLAAVICDPPPAVYGDRAPAAVSTGIGAPYRSQHWQWQSCLPVRPMILAFHTSH